MHMPANARVPSAPLYDEWETQIGNKPIDNPSVWLDTAKAWLAEFEEAFGALGLIHMLDRLRDDAVEAAAQEEWVGHYHAQRGRTEEAAKSATRVEKYRHQFRILYALYQYVSLCEMHESAASLAQQMKEGSLLSGLTIGKTPKPKVKK